MISKNRFLTSTPTRAWIGQFAPKEQELATEMLRKMHLVSRNAFNERIIKLILDRASNGSEPIGLYVERELPETDGVPHPMFEQAERTPARTHGPGPQPVQTPEHKADVVSEGIVAQLVSELCRRCRWTVISFSVPCERPHACEINNRLRAQQTERSRKRSAFHPPSGLQSGASPRLLHWLHDGSFTLLGQARALCLITLHGRERRHRGTGAR